MEIKQLSKKGMFLTFISIAIIAALIVIFIPSNINLGKDLQATETRVSNVNEYVSDLENVYLERALYATGTKALIAMTRYLEAKTIAGTETFFSNDQLNPLYFENAFKF